MNSAGAGAETILIRVLGEERLADWNAYVKVHPDATFCHRSEWRSILENSLGMKTHYLYAQVQGVIKGILPLGEVKSLVFGHTLVSTPFCVYGGVCADSSEIREKLVTRALEIAEDCGVDYVELRNVQKTEANWPGKDFYYTFQKDLSTDQEENFAAIPRKQRAMVRKGIKNDLVSTIDEDLDDFYRVYSHSLRNLGTPVYSRKYFAGLCEHFADDCTILSVRKDGRAIASVLSFYHADTVLPYYGGGLPEARQLKAHDFMYWELMRRSCENNVSRFDFGRSIEGTGSFSFKKNWGFEPSPLYYEQKMIRASKSPDFDPNNSRYRLYIKLWQKLPLPLANFLGPFLAKGLA